MAIMDEEIGLESGGGEVIDATSAISDIAKNKAVGGLAESGEDIGEDEGVHEKTFGELKGNAGGAGGEDSPYALVNLEVVVGRKERDGGVQGRILEDGIGNLILHKSLRRRPRSWRGFVSSALIENSELWWLLDLRRHFCSERTDERIAEYRDYMRNCMPFLNSSPSRCQHTKIFCTLVVVYCIYPIIFSSWTSQ